MEKLVAVFKLDLDKSISEYDKIKSTRMKVSRTRRGCYYILSKLGIMQEVDPDLDGLQFYKKKTLNKATSLRRLDNVSFDLKKGNKIMTLEGDIDAIDAGKKLRKICKTKLVSAQEKKQEPISSGQPRSKEVQEKKQDPIPALVPSNDIPRSHDQVASSSSQSSIPPYKMIPSQDEQPVVQRMKLTETLFQVLMKTELIFLFIQEQ